MRKSLHALFIHGVGTQSSDFSDYAKKQLAASLAKQGTTVYARSVHWAPLLDTVQRGYADRVKARGSRMNLSQKLAVSTLADALAYREDRHIANQIHNLIDYEVRMLRAADFVVFAHSLGGLIMLDYLRSRNQVWPSTFATFGCNVGLFHLGAKVDVPRSVARPGKWLNFFDSSDFLGYPLQASPELAHVQDTLVNVGSWLTSWNGLSHLGYWKDRGFWRRDIPRALGYK